MISVEEALTAILANITPLGSEHCNILEALGRILSDDIYATYDIPPLDNSAMDGYALRWQDTRGATANTPVILELLEDIPAGTMPQYSITTGKASRIMTGAALPENANAVVPKEDAEYAGSHVHIHGEARQGQDIRKAGEDVRKGELVIFRGDIVGPAQIGMLAALGRSFIACNRRPVVAILATGEELAPIDEKLSAGKIVNSNSYSLAALVAACGAIPRQLGIAKDTRSDLLEKLHTAQGADAIITSGGVSVGEFDFVKDIMGEVGNRMQFWQVSMRPGKPLAFGALGEIPLFGLPGNPVSAMVSFEQFVRPALLKLMGHKRLFRPAVKATLQESIVKREGARHFIRARVEMHQEGYRVVTTGEQGSGILKSMVRANCLIVLPAAMHRVQAGEEVTVMLLDDSCFMTEYPSYL